MFREGGDVFHSPAVLKGGWECEVVEECVGCHLGAEAQTDTLCWEDWGTVPVAPAGSGDKHR